LQKIVYFKHMPLSMHLKQAKQNSPIPGDFLMPSNEIYVFIFADSKKLFYNIFDFLNIGKSVFFSKKKSQKVIYISGFLLLP
jgi:hypothetical protein